jgi:hypothetical protein
VKRSKIDKIMHDIEVLERKIQAYETVRRRINNLAKEYVGDYYILEALESIDRTIFNQLRVMYTGLEMLKHKLAEAEKSAVEKEDI